MVHRSVTGQYKDKDNEDQQCLGAEQCILAHKTKRIRDRDPGWFPAGIKAKPKKMTLQAHRSIVPPVRR
jgi:hypothetical protein